MCVVSNIGDQWSQTHPHWDGSSRLWPSYDGPSRAEFNALKKEVEELVDLIQAAKKVDKFLGTPDCDNAEKFEKIRKVFEIFDIDLDAVLHDS